MYLSSPFRYLSTNSPSPSYSTFKTFSLPLSSFPLPSFPPNKTPILEIIYRSIHAHQSLFPQILHTTCIRLSIEEFPQKLQEFAELFQSVQDSKPKYEQLSFYGKNLKPLHSQYKTDLNKVKGCVSQVWFRAYFDDSPKKTVIFEADSCTFSPIVYYDSVNITAI